MKQYGIYIAYVSWGDGGKRRPVLVLSEQDTHATILRITTQYEGKSVSIQSMYLAITDWQQAGLNMPSYIDTSKIINLPITTFSAFPIGKLSERDRQQLIKCLNK